MSGGLLTGLRDAVLGAPLARAVARQASDWIDLQLSLIVASLRDVAPRAHGRLLDVGCGNKPYEALFLPHVSEYIGIEHEATFAATSASASTSPHAKGPDLTYDGRRLPFPDRSFDTVLNIQVLEHTPQPRRLVAEMARVLADDGLLILLAPFQFRLHEQPHDYYRYSPHGLRHLCEEAGLEVEEIRQQGSLWSVIGHKLNTFLAFRVGRVGGVAQAMGKLGHEQATTVRPRLWTLPLVGASMVSIAGAARILDALLAEPDEMLNVLVLARRRPAPPA
jgi:SAM-dependent methyltransferase